MSTIPSQSVENKKEDTNIGSSNEAGTLNSFLRKGFTVEQAVLELVANSLDSFDNLNKSSHPNITETIYFDVGYSETLMMDNAAAMDWDDLETYWDFNRENHSSDNSRGVSGIGGKVALIIASGIKKVKGWTVKPGQLGNSFTADFEEMYKEGKYIGKVQRQKMTEDEMRKFYKMYQDRGMLNEAGQAHGTVLFIPTNDKFRNILIQNFIEPAQCEINPLYRIGSVFGSDKVQFVFNDYETGKSSLNMYDYFGFEQKDYYRGFDTFDIEFWRDEKKKQDRFLYKSEQEGYIEFPVNGRGCAKEAVFGTDVESTIGQKLIAKLQLNVGLLRDKKIFDEEKPELIGGGVIETDYHVSTIGYVGSQNAQAANAVKNKFNDEFLSLTRIRRNKQIIGVCATERPVGTARGSGPSLFKHKLMQSELSLKPVSKQKHDENPLDGISGAQENKNQHNPESLPKNLVRLIDYLVTEKGNSVWNWMGDMVKNKNPSPPKKADEAKKEREEAKRAAEATRQKKLEEEAAKKKLEEEAAKKKKAEETAAASKQVDNTKKADDVGKQNVGPFRRGAVEGGELIDELQRVLASVKRGEQYKGLHVELFNNLGKIQ